MHILIEGEKYLFPSMKADHAINGCLYMLIKITHENSFWHDDNRMFSFLVSFSSMAHRVHVLMKSTSSVYSLDILSVNDGECDRIPVSQE